MDQHVTHSGIRLILVEGNSLPRDVSTVAACSSSCWSGQSPQTHENQVAVSPAEAGINDKKKQPMNADKDMGTDLMTSGSYSVFDSTLNGDNPELEADDYEYPDDYEYDYYEFENEVDEDPGESIVGNYEDLAAEFDGLNLPPGVEATVPWLDSPTPTKSRNCTLIAREIQERYKLFKQFEAIEDCSDHFYFNLGGVANKKPPKDWVKGIQREWKVLEKDLPETIFVRVCENRMDLLRAVIIGPAETPYHDGLFFFDLHFPYNYPSVPPQVYYHSGGHRLNPNLYKCGKVCLSLLGTWSGSGCERWSPGKSTALQVLVSIQGLVLNGKPYFNEPGYSKYAGTPAAEKASITYSENAFLLSCKTMIYAIRRPPKNFEDFVYGHFCIHGRTILIACLAYLNDVQVGSVLPKDVPDVDFSNDFSKIPFKRTLKKLYEDLLLEFTVKGADCDEFLAKKVKGKPTTSDDVALPEV